MSSTPKNNIGKNEHDHWQRKRKYESALYVLFSQQAGRVQLSQPSHIVVVSVSTTESSISVHTHRLVCLCNTYSL